MREGDGEWGGVMVGKGERVSGGKKYMMLGQSSGN
jgi:hypothetical protein